MIKIYNLCSVFKNKVKEKNHYQGHSNIKFLMVKINTVHKK